MLIKRSTHYCVARVCRIAECKFASEFTSFKFCMTVSLHSLILLFLRFLLSNMNYPVYKNCWHSNWVGKGIENQTEVKKKKTLNLLKKLHNFG